MDKAVFDEYVENRYRKQMDYYSKSSSKNQKKYKQFQWILIILSALTPVLAALNGVTSSNSLKIFNVGSQVVQILLVVISSIVAILTTGLKTFRYQDLWIKYRTTYELLKPEIYYYEFNIGMYGSTGTDKEGVFVTRVEAILNTEHSQWQPVSKSQDEKK